MAIVFSTLIHVLLANYNLRKSDGEFLLKNLT